MSYKEALEAAGAEILAFKYFGDYQGAWYGKVKFNNHIGWITDYFGSCDVCDAFQSDFGDKEQTSQENLAIFGLEYLDNILSQDEIEKYAKKNICWDSAVIDIFKFLKENE